MYITAKQHAIIDQALKPGYISSNYLGTDLQNIINYFSKYFARRHYAIQHFLPAYKKRPNGRCLTILFNAYHKKYGFGKKSSVRRTTWEFLDVPCLTKYGRKKYKKRKRSNVVKIVVKIVVKNVVKNVNRLRSIVGNLRNQSQVSQMNRTTNLTKSV